MAAQSKTLDAILVQLQRLVVERGLQEGARAGQGGNQLEHFGMRVRLRTHEVRERRGLIGAWTVEDRALQVIVQRETSGFEFGDDNVVPVLKLFPVQIEFLRRAPSGLSIPAVRQHHAAHIPKQRRHFRH